MYNASVCPGLITDNEDVALHEAASSRLTDDGHVHVQDAQALADHIQFSLPGVPLSHRHVQSAILLPVVRAMYLFRTGCRRTRVCANVSEDPVNVKAGLHLRPLLCRQSRLCTASLPG